VWSIDGKKVMLEVVLKGNMGHPFILSPKIQEFAPQSIGVEVRARVQDHNKMGSHFAMKVSILDLSIVIGA